MQKIRFHTKVIPLRQQTEQDAIRALINGMDPLDWPAYDRDPINEFRTEGWASITFPTLFPYGKGYLTKRTRLRVVASTDALGSIQVIKCPHPGDISQAHK